MLETPFARLSQLTKAGSVIHAVICTASIATACPLITWSSVPSIEFMHGCLQASFQSLQSFDPEAAQALQNVTQMPGQDAAALMQLEGLPLETTTEAYLEHAVQRICVDDVQWQSTSFAQVGTDRQHLLVLCLRCW